MVPLLSISPSWMMDVSMETISDSLTSILSWLKNWCKICFTVIPFEVIILLQTFIHVITTVMEIWKRVKLQKSSVNCGPELFCPLLGGTTGLDTNGCPLGNSKFTLLSDNLNICLWLSVCQVEKIDQINNSWLTIYQRLCQSGTTFQKCKHNWYAVHSFLQMLFVSFMF